jgi:hypothetical protein
MSARASRTARHSGFRFNPFSLFSFQRRRRMASAFAPRRPRSPLLRAAVALIGLGILALLLVFSVLIGIAMLTIGLAWRYWRGRKASSAGHRNTVDPVDPRSIDGEYRVLRKPALPSHLASAR